MPTLMISLDPKVLDESSRVAKRMVEYGKVDRLCILVPSARKTHKRLSPTVDVWGVSNAKVVTFFTMIQKGASLIRTHSIDRVTTQDPFWTGAVGFFLKKKTGISLDVQVHGDFFGSDYFRRSRPLGRVMYRLGLFVLRRADTIRVVSQRIQKSLLTHGISGSRIRLRAVQPDVAVERVVRQPSSHKEFLIVGRFVPIKNITWVIDVFERYIADDPSARLVIVGDGPQRKEIEDLVASHGLSDHVRLVGWVDDPTPYYCRATALLFPSLSEGYGLAVMEARAHGCPVIMTDVGVASYEVPASQDVRIVSVGDADAFLSAMKSV
jgi:L-malate glycosyltransferase